MKGILFWRVALKTIMSAMCHAVTKKKENDMWNSMDNVQQE